MAIDEQTEGEGMKDSLMALGARLEGDEGGEDLSKALTAPKGRDKDEMKVDGEEASSARLSAEKRESVNVDGQDEKGQDLRERLG